MKLTIIGASGHGRVVADIARLNGYDEIVFLDDNESLSTCGNYPVVGNTAMTADGDVFVAIGNAITRKQLTKGRKLTTLIHPNAVIAEDVEIGEGTVVMAGVVINSGTVIGKGCIINTSSSVDHDCKVGNFAHVAVGAHLCGTVMVGNNTWIGAGATILQNVYICDNNIVGAGAVVVKNIEQAGTYVGIPAKKINTNKEI